MGAVGPVWVPRWFCVADRPKAMLLLWFYLFYVLESSFCAIWALCAFRWLGGRLLGEAARSAYGVFSWCRCLVISLVFPTLIFELGISF